MRPRAISKAQPDEFPMNLEGGVQLFGKPKLVVSKTNVFDTAVLTSLRPYAVISNKESRSPEEDPGLSAARWPCIKQSSSSIYTNPLDVPCEILGLCYGQGPTIRPPYIHTEACRGRVVDRTASRRIPVF
jgi:hypothetical protein